MVNVFRNILCAVVLCLGLGVAGCDRDAPHQEPIKPQSSEPTDASTAGDAMLCTAEAMMQPAVLVAMGCEPKASDQADQPMAGKTPTHE